MSSPPQLAVSPVASLRSASAAAGHGLYCGWGGGGPVFSAPEQCALVLGPPRSGKTTSVVLPNVLAANGSVVCISTKRDVLQATAASRAAAGPCYLFDPAGSEELPPGVQRVAWSPLARASDWDRAVLSAEAMVGASAVRGRSGESTHWGERAGALLSCLFHAAAVAGWAMAEVCSAVDRREPERALAILDRRDERVAVDVLTGILETEAREQSGIWSTASGVLRAYRTTGARQSAVGEPLPLEHLVNGTATLYVVAGSDQQEHLAPIIAGLIRDLRSSVYDAAGRGAPAQAGRPPLVLVLDELANIAPLHDLPALVAEGASQGLVTLACLQDLSQARSRWGAAADGFFSLFGTKILLGGIGDRSTLDTVSLLAGEHEVAVRSMSRSRNLLGGARQLQQSLATRRERRITPDEAARPPRGEALCVIGTTVHRISLVRPPDRPTGEGQLGLPWPQRYR